MQGQVRCHSIREAKRHIDDRSRDFRPFWIFFAKAIV